MTDTILRRKPLAIANYTEVVYLKLPNMVPTNATTASGLTNCTKAAIEEFPFDGFTRQERQRGWIVLHVVTACYCFWLLAIVCDDYFVPAMDVMCASELVLEYTG